MAMKWTWSDAGVVRESSVRTIRRSDVFVVHQPIYHLSNGHFFGTEALLRSRIDQLPTPLALIDAALDERAMGRLGRVVRELAVVGAARWPLFLNVHPQELASRWLVRPDDPMVLYDGPVYLEVTESAALEHFDLCRGALRELQHRTGARLVVDDYGAGHANLLRILQLEPDIVKLDRELVRGIDSDRRRQVIVRHTIQLCRELGIRVVAEGIETREELGVVRELGAEWGQGYLLARPSESPKRDPAWSVSD